MIRSDGDVNIEGLAFEVVAQCSCQVWRVGGGYTWGQVALLSLDDRMYYTHVKGDQLKDFEGVVKLIDLVHVQDSREAVRVAEVDAELVVAFAQQLARLSA